MLGTTHESGFQSARELLQQAAAYKREHGASAPPAQGVQGTLF
jgi:hypothetical protein